MKVKYSVLVLFVMLSGCNLSVKFDQPINLMGVNKSSTPNDALACPLNYCQGLKSYTVPIFEFSKSTLALNFQEVIKSEPRITLLYSNPENGQLIYVQRSKFLKFPDTIWVQFIDLKSKSSLMIYSRSNYGYWDFGVNRKRLLGWLKRLKVLNKYSYVTHSIVEKN